MQRGDLCPANRPVKDGQPHNIVIVIMNSYHHEDGCVSLISRKQQDAAAVIKRLHSVGSRLESVALINATFIPMGGPKAHG